MKWILPNQPQNTDLIDWIISNRQIEDKEKFFNSKFEHLHDPFQMYGMQEAVEAIAKAIKENKKIFIHGDFDVDGITATSIMWQFLYRDLNANALPYIPSRFDEGYGLSDESIKAIIKEGGELIITVDCGVKDLEIIEKYKDQIDFVITDHHSLRAKNKENDFGKVVADHVISSSALAVVHPALNNQYPFKEICGAMVSWKVCQALNTFLGTGVDMKKYLDLVSLGTTCDIMPLIDENRVAVKLGLDQLRKTQNLGLQALLDLARVDKTKANVYHLGYIIGPRLNAAGRLKKAIDAVKLLSTNSKENAFKLARELDDLNFERQNLTKKYFEEAEKLIEKDLENKKVIFVHGEEWPEGIVGLIAGKLAQKYNRPTLVGSLLKDGTIKGSARSNESLNIAETLKSLNQHLLKYGGHAGAAGFTLDHSTLPDFIMALEKIANDSINDDDLEEKIYVDAVADTNNLDLDYVLRLNELEPFGYKNHQPLIALLGVGVKNHSLVGKEQNHIKILLASKDKFIDSIAFDKASDFAPTLSNSGLIDVVGTLDIDEWNGSKKMSLKLRDIRPSQA